MEGEPCQPASHTQRRGPPNVYIVARKQRGFWGASKHGSGLAPSLGVEVAPEAPSSFLSPPSRLESLGSQGAARHWPRSPHQPGSTCFCSPKPNRGPSPSTGPWPAGSREGQLATCVRRSWGPRPVFVLRAVRGREGGSVPDGRTWPALQPRPPSSPGPGPVTSSTPSSRRPCLLPRLSRARCPNGQRLFPGRDLLELSSVSGLVRMEHGQGWIFLELSLSLGHVSRKSC